jgi:hypothetical protein
MLSFDAGIKGGAKHYSLSLRNHTAGVSVPPANAEEREAQAATNQSIIGCTAQLKLCPNCNRLLPRDQVEYMVSSIP